MKDKKKARKMIMGFSNEYLTEEEKALIVKTGHALLTRKNGVVYECIPRIATVDRRENIWIIRVRDGYSYEIGNERFIGFYGEISKNKVIDFCVKNLGTETNAKILQKHGVEDINNWELINLNISKDIQQYKVEIINKLEEILTAYAISGHPRENGIMGEFKAILRECDKYDIKR